jgi:hypothetical protein
MNTKICKPGCIYLLLLFTSVGALQFTFFLKSYMKVNSMTCLGITFPDLLTLMIVRTRFRFRYDLRLLELGLTAISRN